MKPRFALDLSNEAIKLLERQAEAWAEIGAAELTDPRLDRRLATLRSMAEDRAPEGFCSKLILPNSQILYLTVDAPGPDAQSRRTQIRRALEGRTPYGADDLTFDWSGSGSAVRVAVLANVTLGEAEAFAEAYGFRPAAFVAVPEDGKFGGEPFFGLTSMAARHLPSGMRYDRDQDPVRTMTVPLQVPDEPDSESGGDAGRAPHDDAMHEATFAEPSADEVAADGELYAADAATATAHGPEPQTDIPETAIEHGAPEAEAADPAPRPESLETGPPEAGIAGPLELAEASADFSFGLVASAAGAVDGNAEADALAEPDAPFVEIAEMDDTPATRRHTPLSAQVTDAAIPDEPVKHEPEPDDHEPGSNDPATALTAETFQSRRLPGHSGREGEKIAAVAQRLGGLHLAADRILPETAPRLTVTAAKAVRDQPEGTTGAARDQMRRLGSALVEFRSRAGMAAKAAGRVGADGLSRLGDQLPKRRETVGPAKDRTIFGAPRAGGDSWRRAGAGLAVAAALLVVTVGLWAFVFSGGDDEVDTSQDVSLPVAEPIDEATAEGLERPAVEAASVPAAQPDDNAASPGVSIAAPTAPSAATVDSATELVSVIADPSPEPTDPALPLGETLAGDRPLPSQPLPQPFGTTFTYDPDGLIEATPEGIVTPGGFTLVAGRPARVPPARPTGIAAAVAPDAALTDPALEGKKPKGKPAALLIAPVTDERGELTGPDQTLAAAPAPPVDPRHSALQPKPRPAGVAEAAVALRENAARLAEAAEAAARAEAEAFEVALRGATPQAVASSRRPASRPAGIATLIANARVTAEPPAVDGGAVEAALAEAQAQPEETTTVAAPEPPPDALDEPEPEEGIATLPTTRTVAKKSTIANAIDLGDVNLIGVYGSSANRRALVRMPNGRYVKVQVGDRLDGGKVAAIGDNELSYVKRGQTIVLKILKKG